DMKLFKKFRGYLLVKTQVNGVYYGECNNITLLKKICLEESSSRLNLA
ncbi:capsular biosynthesis protein, partial [Escherichia coli]